MRERDTSRRFWRFSAWSVLLAGLLLPCSAAVADDYHRSALPISKIELRRLPEDGEVRQVLGQVSDLLLAPPRAFSDEGDMPIDAARKQEILNELFEIVRLYPGGDQELATPELSEDTVTEVLRRFGQIVTIWSDPTTSTHPRHPLNQITFETRPHAGSLSDICVREGVTVYFRPVSAIDGPYTRVAAADVGVSRSFYFLAPPAAPYALEFATSDKKKSTDESCARLHSDKDLFISAPDGRQATRGVWLTNTIQSQLRTGSFSFSLNCNLARTKNPERCVEMVRKSPVLRPWSISDCKPDGNSCGIMLDDGLSLVVSTKRSPILAVERVDITETVIIADYLAD